MVRRPPLGTAGLPDRRTPLNGVSGSSFFTVAAHGLLWERGKSLRCAWKGTLDTSPWTGPWVRRHFTTLESMAAGGEMWDGKETEVIWRRCA